VEEKSGRIWKATKIISARSFDRKKSENYKGLILKSSCSPCFITPHGDISNDRKFSNMEHYYFSEKKMSVMAKAQDLNNRTVQKPRKCTSYSIHNQTINRRTAG